MIPPPLTPVVLNLFGGSVAIDGDTIVVGARVDLAELRTGSAYVFVRSGSTWTQQQKLTDPDAAPDELFGNSVAISDDTIAVGWFDGDKGFQAGAVSVFVRAAGVWTRQQKLTALDGEETDALGTGVAISGDTIVAGAYQEDEKGDDSGSAYVFVRSATTTTWTLQQKLTAPDGAAFDNFGKSVAINGDTVVVGVPRKDTQGEDSGAAYAFVRSGATWGLQAKLLAIDVSAGDQLGASVAKDGDTTLAAAPNPSGPELGFVDVFVRTLTGWRHQRKLTASDGEAGDQFGASVDIDRASVVVGAPFDEVAVGSAYVFVRNGTSAWSQQMKLRAGDGVEGDRFGTAVGISGDTAVVGAPVGDGAEADSGSAYVFVRSGTSTWSQQMKLTADDGQALDSFGSSVAISGDRVVVGAPGDDDDSTDAGAAYVFLREGAVWSQHQKLTASVGASGARFGSSVALIADDLVTGAPGDDQHGPGSGAVYVFEEDTAGFWGQRNRLTASDGAAGDAFGTSVATYGGGAAVGAANADRSGASDSGWFYLYRRPASDLSVSKGASPDPVIAGATLTYTLVMTNNGPDTSTVAVLEDKLPAGVTFVTSTASQGSCDETGGTVTCSVSGMAAGGSAQFTIAVRVDVVGQISNSAGVSAVGPEEDPDATNNTSTVIVTARVNPLPGMSGAGLVALAAAMATLVSLGIRRRRAFRG